MSSSAVESAILPFGSFAWFNRELAPTHLRKIRTAIMVGGAVSCVIISMALQVPELSVSAYMPFFISQPTKEKTKLVSIIGLIGLTVGIVISLLLYKFTYGHPELRIPGMAIALFLGMWLSRVFFIGILGFLIGFIVSYSQSLGETIPSPELIVRGLLWLWVAIAYAVVITLVLNLLFLPDAPNVGSDPAKPKAGPEKHNLFVPDAFTNQAHVHFALKVTFSSIFCYIVYMAIDWTGIHTALITCTFIALESTGATLHKGVLRIAGCVIGGALALFTIVFVMPHMETIASLVVVVACACAIAGWFATGTERISYAGLQIAFAYFYSVFQGFAPDTDLDNVRDRVIGILFGLVVTGIVFAYIWPERTVDRLRDALRIVLQQLARLIPIPRPETSIQAAKGEVHPLIGETSTAFDKARRYVELTQFEFEEAPDRGRASLRHSEATLSRAEKVFVTATSLTSDQTLAEWQQLPPIAKTAESNLRSAVAKRIQRAADSDVVENNETEFSEALQAWNETVRQSHSENSRNALVSQVAAEVQDLG